VHVFENVFGDLEKDYIILNVFFFELVSANAKNDEAYMGSYVLFRLYLSTIGVSVVRETWSAPIEKA